jgi:hypothetical protein
MDCFQDLTPCLSVVCFSLGFWSSSNPLYTGYTGYAGYTGYTVALLPVTPFQRISVSEHHRISISAYQRSSVSAYQRSSVSTFQRTSVPAYQRISVLRCRLATYQALSRTAYQRRTTSGHALPQLSFFPEFVAALAFVANGRVWLQNAKKKPGKCPRLKIKRIAKKTKQQSPPKNCSPY